MTNSALIWRAEDCGAIAIDLKLVAVGLKLRLDYGLVAYHPAEGATLFGN